MIDKAKWMRIWGFADGSPEGEAAWAEKLRPSRSVAAPYIKSDHIAPTRGADGRMHDSLSSYRKSLEPGGNPRGERFIELGNESLPTVTYDFDRKQRRDDIRAGLEDVKNGRVPTPVILEG